MSRKYMKTFMARGLAVLFILSMMFGAFPVAALAEEPPAERTEPTYNVDDIVAMNALIDAHPGIGLPKSGSVDGSTIPEWKVSSQDGGTLKLSGDDSSTNRRIIGLTVTSRNLTGTLDVSGLSALLDLVASKNQLTSVNISGCSDLCFLHIDNNLLTTIDVSNCTKLEMIWAGGNCMPAQPIGSGIVGIENVTAFREWDSRAGGFYFYYSLPPQKTAVNPNPAPEPAPSTAPEPAPAPAAVVDLAPPSGGEAGTAVPANTNLVAVAASGGDVATMSQLVASQGIAGNLIQTLHIKLYDAGGSPISGACTIRVNIPELTANDRVTILHLFDNGTTERIAATARNGYCTFRVSKFSLFGVVVNKGGGSRGTTPNSPQTGIYE